MLARQQELGLDVFTDREFRRRNFMSDFTDTVEGFDLGDAVARSWTGASTAPASVTGIVTQKLRPRRSLTAHGLAFLRAHSPGPIKITLVPYIQIDAPRCSCYIDPKWRTYIKTEMGMEPDVALDEGHPHGQHGPRRRPPARRDTRHPPVPQVWTFDVLLIAFLGGVGTVWGPAWAQPSSGRTTCFSGATCRWTSKAARATSARR